MPYLNLQRLFDASAPSGIHAYWKTEYLDELEDGAMDALVGHAGRMRSPFSAVHVHHLGGAVARVAPEDTAFTHRRARYAVNVVGMWTEPKEAEEHIVWTRGLWQAVRGCATGGAYLNFMGADDQERVQAAYGDSAYARLQELKRRYVAVSLGIRTSAIPRAGSARDCGTARSSRAQVPDAVVSNGPPLLTGLAGSPFRRGRPFLRAPSWTSSFPRRSWSIALALVVVPPKGTMTSALTSKPCVGQGGLAGRHADGRGSAWPYRERSDRVSFLLLASSERFRFAIPRFPRGQGRNRSSHATPVGFMASSRWHWVQDALWAALEREPPAREAFLTGHCAGDAELLAEVHSLLEAHEGAGAFLGGPVPSDSGSPPGGTPRVRRLLQEAADLTTVERTAWIEAAPPHDASLRREVAALLHVYERGVGASPGRDPPPGPDPFLGRTISHYEIFEKLGEGGMGVVYRARDTRLGRVVALKFPAPGLAGDADARARVLREARAASALDHVNICTIHEIGETDAGQVFIAMACYAGETLQEKLQRSRLPLDEVLGYAIDVAQGLAKAHEHGLAHRDIKPANVMVTDDGVVKLLDFGLAEAGDECLTEAGVARATPAYMSPEQARGERVDHRSDIWSLGVMLYEMLTGCRPFRGGHAQAVIHAVLHEVPETVATRRPEMPALLEQIIARALARRVADRYADAEAMLRDLRQVQDDVASAHSAAAATAAGPAGPLERPPGGEAALNPVVDGLLRKQPGERHATAAPASRELEYAADGEPRRGWLRPWRSRQLLPSIPVVGLAVAAAAAALVTFGIEREKPPPAVPVPAHTEIAVLPFQNLSAGGPHAYFAAGLHNELLTQLSKVGALTVMSRTSVMAYEGTSTPLRQIAAELRVGSVLEGTVQVLDGRLRVTVQLIDPATDAHVWSNRYDRPLEDAFAMQSDIAQRIATAVGVNLSRDDERRLAEAPTPNTEAYHLYLQAQAYLLAPTGDYWPRHVIAQQLLEQALALDAAFVLAYVELSLVHGRMYWGRFDATPARAASQWEAAEAALQLAPHLPEAQWAMGLAHYYGRRDYERALEWFARGLEGQPNDYRLLMLTGGAHRRLGNWDQAIAAKEHAARFDPRGRINPDGVGNTLAIQRRYKEAVRVYDRYLQRMPDASGVRLWKANAFLHWEGQLDSLRAVVGHLPADRGLGGAGNRTAQHLRLLFLERQADSLLYLLGTTDTRTFEMQFSFVPAALYAAWAQRLRGDHRAARVQFDSARALLDTVVLQQPDDPRVHAARGLALAGLGRRDEALDEARWLEQSEIYRNDAYEGPIWAEQRARILAQLGDAEAALDEIEGLLSRPSWLSVNMLRLDPLLDPIRGQPRFRALLTGSAQPQREPAVTPSEAA